MEQSLVAQLSTKNFQLSSPHVYNRQNYLRFYFYRGLYCRVNMEL